MTSTKKQRNHKRTGRPMGRPRTWPPGYTKKDRDKLRMRIKRTQDRALIALLETDPKAALVELQRRTGQNPLEAEEPAAEDPLQNALETPTRRVRAGRHIHLPTRGQELPDKRHAAPERHCVPVIEKIEEVQEVREEEGGASEQDASASFEQAFPNVAEAFEYAERCAAGDENVCKWVRLAAQRHLRDLERSTSEEFPYAFDPQRAERVLRITQRFKEFKGPRAGQRLKFRAWQKFIIASAFGWVHKITTARRFRYVLCYVPRGNGKTTMAAPVSLYMLSLDGEGGAEVYAAAVTRDQARLLFGAAQTMARNEPEFRQKFGIEVGANAITREATASSYKPLSRDAQSLDGLNVSFAALDELAQHKLRDVHDVLLTATGKRSQAMMWAITTSSSNQAGIGFEQWKYAQKILSGQVDDDTFFAILYTVDKGDDWRHESTWIKANPNWGVSVMPDVISKLCERAQSIPAQQAAFQQKHLNIWTNADTPWISPEQWAQCGDESLNEDQFKGDDSVLALDLASKLDYAAKVKLFTRTPEGQELPHFYLFATLWLPQKSIEASGDAALPGWIEQGYVLVGSNAAEPEVNSYELIEESVKEDAKRFHVVDVAYDPWQAAQLSQNLDSAGIPVIEYRPTVQNFSAAMKEIDALTRTGRLHHDGNPAMAWMISNVVCHMDAKDNIFPRKERPENKIDGPVAAIMAMGRMLQVMQELNTEQGFVAL